VSKSDQGSSVVVMVPTRNRSGKLAQCLDALSASRQEIVFSAVVLDASDEPESARARDVVSRYPWAFYVRHDGRNVAAARNACIRAAQGDILINVDDDVYVEPGAIRALVRHLSSGADTVVAGAVAWPNAAPSTPVKMRMNGYGRPTLPSESPDFLVGALFGYTRALATRFPWNEHIQTSDDRFMGGIWRAHGISLNHAADALAHHDTESTTYDERQQRSHIYANLCDAVLVRKSVRWTLGYMALGFPTGLRGCRSASAAGRYVVAWGRGIADFVGDMGWLRDTYGL
jgi:glycosyltransferase involved in cell wall biosynthesis